MKEQIQQLAEQGGNPSSYFAFAAGLANNLPQHSQFFNEFINNLAFTEDQELVDLLKNNPEAFIYLLAMRLDGKENYSTLDQYMVDYVGELKNYVEQLEKYVQNQEINQEFTAQQDLENHQDFTAAQDLQKHKALIEYFEDTTVAKLMYEKFEALENTLKAEAGLAQDDENLLDSFYKKVLEVQEKMMTNFNEIAAKQ